RDAEIVQVAVDGLDGLGAVEIEDHVGVGDDGGVTGGALVVLVDGPGALQVSDDGVDQVVGRHGQRPVLAGEVDFGLDAAAPGGGVGGGQHVREAEPGEGDVLVVEVGDLAFREVRPVDAHVDQHAGGAGEALGGLDHVPRGSLDHGDEVRQGHRGDQGVVADGGAVGEA